MNSDIDSFVDLHIHSVFSDGTCTPEELADLAVKQRLAAIALSDHDTAEGIPRLLKACKDLNLQTIPGIELSCTWNGKSIHILGYGMDWQRDSFRQKLKEWQSDRETRNSQIIEQLQKRGYDLSMELLHLRFPDAVLTRANIAVFLAETKQVPDKNWVFSNLIGKGCPCHVPRKPVAPEEAIRFLLDHGGIPVFAHPILSRMCEIQLDEFTGYLKAFGLMGIEGYYSGYSASDEAQIKRIAKKYDLFLTGGSDFHGAAKPSISIGTGKGKLQVPRSCFQSLLEAQSRLQANGALLPG